MSAREIFEIGLHKRSVLFKNFSDFRERELALRAFWCVYVLDRQFSFGTGLSFAIPDREIDPQLPEPVRLQYSSPVLSHQTLAASLMNWYWSLVNKLLI